MKVGWEGAEVGDNITVGEEVGVIEGNGVELVSQAAKINEEKKIKTNFNFMIKKRGR